MHSFLVNANMNNTSSKMILERAGSITKELVSSFGMPVTAHYKIIPEIKGGWFYLIPTVRSVKNIIS
jgi:hypothetical protein